MNFTLELLDPPADGYESEEARLAWVEENNKRLEEYLDRTRPAREKLKRELFGPPPKRVAISIRLDPDQLAQARRRAAEQDIPYQSYLQQLIWRGLLQDEPEAERQERQARNHARNRKLAAAMRAANEAEAAAEAKVAS